MSRPQAYGGLGIHRARDMNVAFLGKLVWEFTPLTPKFWVVFMRQKFEPSFDVLALILGGKGSSTWNVMVRARGLFKQGFKPRLGSSDVSFWYGPCLDIALRLRMRGKVGIGIYIPW